MPSLAYADEWAACVDGGQLSVLLDQVPADGASVDSNDARRHLQLRSHTLEDRPPHYWGGDRVSRNRGDRTGRISDGLRWPPVASPLVTVRPFSPRTPNISMDISRWKYRAGESRHRRTRRGLPSQSLHVRRQHYRATASPVYSERYSSSNSEKAREGLAKKRAAAKKGPNLSEGGPHPRCRAAARERGRSLWIPLGCGPTDAVTREEEWLELGRVLQRSVRTGTL
jgi:hypothetical protein